MSIDRSEGWDAAAAHFMAARTSIGTSLVRMWAQKTLPPGGSVVDVGCGSGFPIAVALSDDGFKIFGIDASPTLIAEFRRNLPCAEAVCEAAQDSEFFHRKFDAAISIGLLFLVDVEAQAKVIRRVSDALVAGGHYLFSAPLEACEWKDATTARWSRSIGKQEYEKLLNLCGLDLVACHTDEGNNNYFEAVLLA